MPAQGTRNPSSRSLMRHFDKGITNRGNSVRMQRLTSWESTRCSLPVTCQLLGTRPVVTAQTHRAQMMWQHHGDAGTEPPESDVVVEAMIHVAHGLQVHSLRDYKTLTAK